jgi:4-hydroxythreonine-4-phosphate dehydrogenase
VTSGEPAGIGPDICLGLAFEPLEHRVVFVGDPVTFAARAVLLARAPEIEALEQLSDADPHEPGRLQVLPVPLAARARPGLLDPANARAVLSMLKRATAACLTGQAAALVTAPVHKSAINAAGIAFTGHTEFLAELTGTDRVVMLLASASLRVALVTTHLPLASVPAAITTEGLRAALEIVARDCAQRLGIEHPRILVLGLNPHAGEDGVLGDEEQTTIRPVVESLEAAGLDVRGPVAADTAFTKDSLAGCDVVVAMYHDQGLAPLKAMHFGEIVNLTLGLPIVRTSVDHGTALELAGTGRARHESLRAALELAAEIVARERR